MYFGSYSRINPSPYTSVDPVAHGLYRHIFSLSKSLIHQASLFCYRTRGFPRDTEGTATEEGYLKIRIFLTSRIFHTMSRTSRDTVQFSREKLPRGTGC